MKRLVIFILLFVLILLFPGCGRNKAFDILICGHSDSVPEIDTKVEYSKWNKSSYVDKDQPQTVEGSVGDMHYRGSYVSSDISKYEYYPTHQYEDENGHFFEVDPDLRLTSFFWGSDASSSVTKKTKDECVKIATDFLNAIVDTSDYNISAEYDDTRDFYTIYYEKYIGDIVTDDRAEIVVESSGHMYSYSSSMLGRIKIDADIPFDLDKVEEELYKKLDKMTEKARTVYDSVVYSDLNYIISMKNDTEYILIIYLDIDCINHYDDVNTTLSERLSFVVLS